MVVAVDFDGTIAEDWYPVIGMHIPGAIESLRKFQEHGIKLILYTMRSDKLLQDAIDYCKDRGVEFWAVNENPEQKEWTNSDKIYADMYIDDRAIGTPKINFHDENGKYLLDWGTIRKKVLAEIGIYE